jgi:multidrug efflux pump subunit AcrA (membrane-fusion protein)
MPRLTPVAALAALVLGCSEAPAPAGRANAGRPPAPVEAAPMRVGELVLRRTFSGTLEATRDFTVAPKVGGRLATLEVDIGDVVEDGAVIATIDDDELVQLVAESEAELAVARADHGEAESAHIVAQRSLQRVESLSQQGITSQAELDTAQVNEFANRSRVEVARAQILRAEAELEGARIRLGHARVIATWDDRVPDGVESAAAPENGGGSGDSLERLPRERRIVGRRFVDAGGFVTAGTPLVSIVDLDPIHAVITVPERDYSRLALGLTASLVTDAYPGDSFAGVISRLAPVFNRSTRQARVELVLENPDLRLKPGMFVRATLELQRVTNASIVPFAALAERGEQQGLFVLDEAGTRVSWVPVTIGVREDEDVVVHGEGLDALAAVGRRVVVLGQELCDDGALVKAIEAPTRNAAPDAQPADSEADR